MTPLRLAILTPRFWPQVGDGECIAWQLAEAFQEQHASVCVVTGCWSTDWPRQMLVRETLVHRVAHAPRGGWSTIRYMLDLSRWLRQHQSQLDAVYVMGLRYEAYAALGALFNTELPVVLCHYDLGPAGDCAWHHATRFGERIRRRCSLAPAVVATGPVAASELDQAGFAPDRVWTIPIGMRLAPARSADLRFRARAALADANHDLAVAEYAPLVVHVGRLIDSPHLIQLIRAWRDIAARWPSARLWLIGEGPARSDLYQLLSDLELQYQVMMPGTFEDLTDIWNAADIYVSPHEHSGYPLVMEAMAAGLPVLAADSPTLRATIEHGRTGLLVAAGDTSAWSSVLVELGERPELRTELGQAARQAMERQSSRPQLAQRHMELLQQLQR